MEGTPKKILSDAISPDSLTPELQKSDVTDGSFISAGETPTQPAEDILDSTSGTVAQKPVELGRETLLSRAQKFLGTTSVQDHEESQKRGFLMEKGLSRGEIDNLLHSVSTPPPPIPPRTYPGATPPSRLPQLLLSLSRLLMKLSVISAISLAVYFRFILPALSYVLHARQELYSQRISHIAKLRDQLDAISSLRRIGSDSPQVLETTGPSSIDDEAIDTSAGQEPKKGGIDSIPTALSNLTSKLRLLSEQRSRGQNRIQTLESLSNLTGYISSQVHFAPSKFGPAKKTSTLGPVEEEIRREIKALKGLALNRRTFVSTSSITQPKVPSSLSLPVK